MLAAAAAVAALAGVALAVPVPVRTFFFEENLHQIAPGVYRSAQPSAAELEAMIEKLGLRTVVNLRGERGGRAWLEAERAVAAAHGLAHHSVRFSADRMPPSQRLREVVRLLDTEPRPLLLHCQGGVERSGLVGAVAVLLAGGDLEAARAEFAPTRGYVGFIALSDLPLVIDAYAAWLDGRGEAHTPDRFRHWVDGVYAPYFYRAQIEPLDGAGALRAGHEEVLRFRVTNRSTEAIPFRASRERGVHLGAVLRPAAGGEPERIDLRSGFVDLELAPGASTELELPLPPLAPGRWELHVDLVDEQVKWFADMGSEPLSLALDVRPPGGTG